MSRVCIPDWEYQERIQKAAKLVREKNLDVLRDLAKQNGMVTLWNSCKTLVEKGVTSIQELMTLNVE